MDYFEMFKNLGTTEDEANFINTQMAFFDIDFNCEISYCQLFCMVEEKFFNSDSLQPVRSFIMDLVKLYRQTGFNLGAWFFYNHFKKEYKINLDDVEPFDLKLIYNINEYLENLFNKMWDVIIKKELESRFAIIDKQIDELKLKMLLDKNVPESEINSILESEEVKQVSYYFIKDGFKSGFTLCLAYNTLHITLKNVEGHTPPEDWPQHILNDLVNSIKSNLN